MSSRDTIAPPLSGAVLSPAAVHGPEVLSALTCVLLLCGCSAGPAAHSKTSINKRTKLHQVQKSPGNTLAPGRQLHQLAGQTPQSQRDPAKREPRIIRRGPASSHRVALTFDDGPTPRTTPRILDILKQTGTKATFFMVGRMVRRHPDLALRVAREGHLLANHTWDHPKRGTTDDWRRQIHRTEMALYDLGLKPSRFFRPAHGIVNPRVTRACADLGYTIVLYTMLSSDWKRPGAQALTKQVVWHAKPGSVVVLHDGGGDRSQTIEALPKIIEGLRLRGLEPVRLDRLLGGL